MKYILFSKTDILVEVSHFASENLQNENILSMANGTKTATKNEIIKLNLKLPLELEKGQVVKVFSFDKSFIPFCFEVGCYNKNVKTIELESTCLLEISPEQILSGEVFGSMAFTGGIATVVGSPFCFNIMLEEEKFVHKFSERLYDFKIRAFENVVFVTGKCIDGDICVVFHKNQKQFLEFYGDIEITPNKICAVKKLHTLARHGELVEYEINENCFNLVSCEPIYLGGKPAFISPFLSHIAFFEALKVKDYMLAKSYLTDEFATNIQPEHFAEFFGEFEQVIPLKEKGQTKVALLQKRGNNDFFGKTYALEFENNKIKNIFSST